jgi:hypothetical protein
MPATRRRPKRRRPRARHRLSLPLRALAVPIHCCPWAVIEVNPCFASSLPARPPQLSSVSSLLLVVAAEKHLHTDRHLRPWNCLADATASTACAPNFSPSHEPGATTTGRRSPRRSPPAAHPPPWSMFYGEFPLSPPPKIRPLFRRHASRPFPPPPLTAGHRNRPAPPSPVRQRPGLPCLSCFAQGLVA